MKFEQVKVVSVFGSGLMGAGITQVFALQDYKVFVRARRQTSLDEGLKRIQKSLQKAAEKEIITEAKMKSTLANIHMTTDLAEAAREADFIVESVPEKVDQKNELYEQIVDVNELAERLQVSKGELEDAMIVLYCKGKVLQMSKDKVIIHYF